MQLLQQIFTFFRFDVSNFLVPVFPIFTARWFMSFTKTFPAQFSINNIDSSVCSMQLLSLFSASLILAEQTEVHPLWYMKKNLETAVEAQQPLQLTHFPVPHFPFSHFQRPRCDVINLLTIWLAIYGLQYVVNLKQPSISHRHWKIRTQRLQRFAHRHTVGTTRWCVTYFQFSNPSYTWQIPVFRPFLKLLHRAYGMILQKIPWECSFVMLIHLPHFVQTDPVSKELHIKMCPSIITISAWSL